jgi:hypothetical protein
MTARRRNQNHERRSTIFWNTAAIVLPVLAFIGGMALNAFTIAEKIATKPYVDERFIDSRKYTDDRSMSTLKEAFEHSDTNRAAMMLEMEKYNGNVKAVEVKVDAVTLMLSNLYKEIMVRDRHPTH